MNHTNRGTDKRVYFFLIIVTEYRMRNFVNLFSYTKIKQINECIITLNTLKLSVKVTRRFFFDLVRSYNVIELVCLNVPIEC